MKSPPTSTVDLVSDLSRGFAILLAFLGGGDWISRSAGLPIPGSVIGMALLTIALLTGLVKMRWVEAASAALLSRLGLFFIPPGVGVMLYFELIARQWLPILGAMIGSTLAVLWVTAGLAQWLIQEDQTP